MLRGVGLRIVLIVGLVKSLPETVLTLDALEASCPESIFDKAVFCLSEMSVNNKSLW